MKNSLRYIPDPKYYDLTKNREISPLLKKSVSLLGSNQKKALDFGCGAGSETKFLLEHNFTVTAVDGNQDSERYITQLARNGQVQFIHSDFENFTFGSYDLINASKALSFIHVDEFEKVIHRLLTSLKPAGIFVGDIYGINDQWNQPGETMTFLDKRRLELLFKDLTTLNLTETKQNGKLANGKSKYIHLLSFLVQKPARH